MTADTADQRPPVQTVRKPFFRKRSAIPGFGLTMGVTLTILSLLVLIPLSAVVLKAAQQSPAEFWAVATSERAMAAYRLSFGAAFVAAAINGVFGVLTAWVLVRYEFPLKTLVNALVDLPFALPTAVAGIALATLYAPTGWVGQFLTPLGVKAAYNPVGVVIALIFIGLPFVVRTVEPVLRDAAADVEEAAASLGASRIQTIARIILPALGPAWLTGFAMAFARGVGEYGSVIFIAGNMPYRSEIAPLLIIIQLEQFEYTRAATIAVVMLAVSFLMLLIINAIQAWARRFD
ncbi:sulfate ABC transporter permease subunit CysT [Caulobacter vibrioides]|nr:sulfate ABC transporter permease subunit CysT [Caulobacter vibrioides]YP_002517041.1 sulfate transport system permease protein cysT [Caulobacter vibrioides NA1000]ACL95133.1 sulfate transport system permease protein cysT [Caulobacter vibrioides NA1000]ATC30639.1 sulfate ABC transporter permease subunit CysT [Caulobacter vibrioides]QXZ53663.1 sulfate ABC transporter permease subunit CysT [Caulobacter vibrioides]